MSLLFVVWLQDPPQLQLDVRKVASVEYAKQSSEKSTSSLAAQFLGLFGLVKQACYTRCVFCVR